MEWVGDGKTGKGVVRTVASFKASYPFVSSDLSFPYGVCQSVWPVISSVKFFLFIFLYSNFIIIFNFEFPSLRLSPARRPSHSFTSKPCHRLSASDNPPTSYFILQAKGFAPKLCMPPSRTSHPNLSSTSSPISTISIFFDVQLYSPFSVS